MSTNEHLDKTLIADLARAGVDPDLINRVANVLWMSADVRGRLETFENRRAKWREDKRKLRNRRADISENGKNLPSLSSSSSFPLKGEEEEEKKKKELSAPLPARWEPSASHFEEGAALGFSRDEVLDQAQDMRLWAGGKGVRRPSWTMTFSGWMRRTRKTFVGQTRRKADAAGTGEVDAEKQAALEWVANHERLCAERDRQMAQEAIAKRKGNGHAN